jgi:broad specificity phosphatase PhoE
MGDSQPTRLILIPTGQTCWDAEGRLVGNTDLPLCPEGLEQVRRWAESLKEIGLEFLFASPGGASEETEEMIAGAVRVRPRQDIELAEINLGLWQGMTLAEIKARHPRVYRQWLDAPESVTPPEGESLGEAKRRLEECIERILRRYCGSKIGVILGDIALALVRLSRESRAMSDFWLVIREPRTWHEYLIENVESVKEF